MKPLMVETMYSALNKTTIAEVQSYGNEFGKAWKAKSSADFCRAALCFDTAVPKI